jgi:hypothetical protein
LFNSSLLNHNDFDMFHSNPLDRLPWNPPPFF